MPLPRRLKFRAMLQGEQAPEQESGSQAETRPGSTVLQGGEEEEVGTRGEHREAAV